ncbi:DUF2812 domain-containing protein [Bacillus massilinigeriensis]|uniref:DUF2812 domain-containing protein n=1 Tax=Bacillus massilionigeriensis TaxID=1805475 RepID=UPI00096B5F2F|nr:DUF2812 domain-containing protein [Bacillus massilionigeriensis]
MMHIVRKAYFDFEKEEKFLNDMAAKGFALTNYSWCKYVFEDAPRGEYIYRLELLEHPINHPESRNYLQFMEEMGAEVVTNYHRWVYFRKKAVDGEFQIYTDYGSLINHYHRIRLLFLIIAAFNFLIGIYNYYMGYVETSMGSTPINTYVSIVSFSVAALLLIFLILPLTKKIEDLKKEKDIRDK